MKGWLGDMARMVGALWYWNARKTAFVLRGRRGACPCHNPSDSGRPFETGCEGATYWNQPRRFARVCPLLKPNAAGVWVCSVSPAGVRPFWGRALAYHAAAAVTLAVLAGLTVFGAARAVGFHATPRQIFWPPAWHELRQVRAQYFVNEAEALLAKGKIREAALSLSTAWEMSPDNYAIGMVVAQFYVAWRPDLVDGVYQRLYQHHPEHREEISRAWLRSLLARGDPAGVAELARKQLAEKDVEPTPWTHALLEAARFARRPAWLKDALENAARPEVREVIELELRVWDLPEPAARPLLFSRPATPGFSYAYYQRIDRLIELGDGREALALLAQARSVLSGRDVVRLGLGAYAAAGELETLRREGGGLLQASDPTALIGGVTLLGLHLLARPDGELLRATAAVAAKFPPDASDGRGDAVMAVYFAAGFAGAEELLPPLRNWLATSKRSNPVTLGRIDDLMKDPRPDWPVQALLSLAQPMSLELNYALLDKYERLRRAAARR